ncbi:hypothetical protein [Paenibacillus tundrae]|uniref:Uncharacterized protein n=1 Tax=Paenibacillus tundrae TaxID=528187 RepID=A0ABT9WIR5_9BACL|nr:hypothetical protein [Paenibacillus tundrae]MDQ0173060.1 hypothetical protein [Paenibacillus tundrae]
MDESKELEQRLRDMLMEGNMEDSGDAEQRERQLIPPKYEVRIQTERDPIVEETLKFRQLAREVDDRYDRYLERAAGNKPDTDTVGPNHSKDADPSQT